MKPVAETTLPPIPASFVRTLLVRVAMLLVFAGSVWLVWWSLQRLTLVLRQSQQKASEVSALGNEVQRLQGMRSREEIESIEARYQEAQAAVFSGPEDYAAWEQALRVQTRALNFEALITPGRPYLETNVNPNLSLRHATVDLRPILGDEAGSSPYERLLTFAGTLEKTRHRVDVVELSVLGDFNSVHQARAVLEAWSRGEGESLKR